MLQIDLSLRTALKPFQPICCTWGASALPITAVVSASVKPNSKHILPRSCFFVVAATNEIPHILAMVCTGVFSHFENLPDKRYKLTRHSAGPVAKNPIGPEKCRALGITGNAIHFGKSSKMCIQDARVSSTSKKSMPFSS